MKRILKAMLVVGALFSCMASGAWAYPTSGNINMSGRASGSTDGGAFNVTYAGYSFTTFCLETNEYIDLYGTYSVTTADYANKGGTGGATDGKDFLSNETKWLYWNYVTGKLHDKVDLYVYGNDKSTTALQLLIWSLENETTTFSPDSETEEIMAALDNKYDEEYEKGVSIGTVEVMNLMKASEYKQSLLIADPDSTPVPEPGTMVLLGAGMLGLAVFGKRRMNREA